MKWRNSKERELLTSSTSLHQLPNQFVDGTNSSLSTLHSTGHAKTDDCDDRKAEDEILATRSPALVYEDESDDSSLDIDDNSTKE